MSKIFLFLKLNIIYMFRNKVRFLLTLAGISIGLLVYLVGNIAVDTYIKGLYKTAYEFAENSIIVSADNSKYIDKLKKLEDNIIINKFNLSGDSFVIKDSYTYKGVQIKNSMNIVGIETGIQNNPLPDVNEDNDFILSETKILYGRDFADNDIKQGKNYIIIEKTSAMFLFQKENAVGEKIDIISLYGYDTFEIIGIIDDFPVTRRNNLKFNKIMEKGSSREYKNSVMAFTTYDYLEKMVGEENIQKKYIGSFKNLNDEQIAEKIKKIDTEADIYDLNVNIASRSKMLEEVRNTEKQMRSFINTIICIIILVSGFMIVTIYIFSIKERMYEIGVRRAIGASSFDIIKQFVSEGIITAAIAGLVTLAVGIFICNFGNVFLLKKLFIDVKLVISGRMIFSLFGLSVLQGIVFCSIPAVIASRIRPTEAIRWD